MRLRELVGRKKGTAMAALDTKKRMQALGDRLTTSGAAEEVEPYIVSSSIIPMAEKRSPMGWKMARGLAILFGVTYAVLFVDLMLEHEIGFSPLSPAKLIPLGFSLLAAGVGLAAGAGARG